ncbi:MAG TPA: hypothetical protein VIJ94_09300 [Caulobacteraceae bacterium]
MSTTRQRLDQWAADLQAAIDAAHRGGIPDYQGIEVTQLADLKAMLARLDGKLPTVRVFLDAYKSLRFVDRADLYDVDLKLNDMDWGKFCQNPVKWLIEATDADAEKAWRAVEKRAR